MNEIPAMYRKLASLARDLKEKDKENDEEIARRLRYTKKEVRAALVDLKRGIW
jgi:guanylate kinase